MRKVKQFLGVYLLAVGLLAAGCTEEVEPSYINSDQDFITYAAHSNVFKAQASRQATQLAATNEIKALGKEFFDYYSVTANQLMIIGQENGFKVPMNQSESNQEIYNSMDRLWGQDYEMRYLTEMQKIYQEDIKWFEEATRKLSSEEVKVWVNKQLPVLRNQQSYIQQILTSKENL